MDWAKAADRVLKTAIDTFKTAAVYTRLAAPGSPIILKVVFDRPNLDPNPGQASVPVDSVSPRAGIRLADLPADPLPGDRLVIALGIAAGTYLIIGVEPDGQGGAELELNEVG